MTFLRRAPSRSRSADTGFAGDIRAMFATAGVAIGLGNIWRFPYMMGRDGGAAFLLIYLAILFLFGAPMLMCELALGRRTKHGPWGAIQASRMPLAGLLAGVLMLTVIMAASYYAVVIGWVAQEAVAFARRAINPERSVEFSTIVGGPRTQFFFLFLVVAAGCCALALGIRRGIEKLSTVLLPIFFLILLAILVRVLTLPGAGAELKAFLSPNWNDFSSRTAFSALGQAVFSLGLGGTFMVQYGSYLREEQSIPRTALFTVATDTLAALLAGAIIVPAVLALGLDLDSGPSLLFSVMPSVFTRMPFGVVIGMGFFFAVFIVAMLSLIAAYEVIVGALGRAFNLSRGRALALIFLVELALAVPAYLIARYIELSDLLWGTTMQPIGAAIAVIALTWSLGRAHTLAEFRRGARLPVPTWLYWWMRFVIPGVILVIVVAGWREWLAGG